jgi:hypothetical protein
MRKSAEEVNKMFTAKTLFHHWIPELPAILYLCNLESLYVHLSSVINIKTTEKSQKDKRWLLRKVKIVLFIINYKYMVLYRLSKTLHCFITATGLFCVDDFVVVWILSTSFHPTSWF